MHHLSGLSFREYLNLTQHQSFQAFSLADICQHHQQITHEICQAIRPLTYFKDYLKQGYYPHLQGGEDVKLCATILKLLPCVRHSLSVNYLTDTNCVTPTKPIFWLMVKRFLRSAESVKRLDRFKIHPNLLIWPLITSSMVAGNAFRSGCLGLCMDTVSCRLALLNLPLWL